MHPESTLHDLRRDWLAAALRGERPEWLDDTDNAIAGLLDAAEQEGVASLVDAAMRASGTTWKISRALVDGFAAAAREQVALELMRHAELVRVVRALATAGIHSLLLKGSALAYSVYPAAYLRPRIDIDLLVPSAAIAESSKPVLAALGYVASQVSTTAAIGYELILRRQAPAGHVHWIDVHWALANQALYADTFAFDELAATAIALPALDESVLGDGARGLGCVHALLHACMHRISNLPTDDGDRLFWLYDMDLLTRRFSAGDFEQLLAVAQQRGLAGACWDGLRHAAEMFATPMPAGLLNALECTARSESFDVRKAHRRWYQEWHNLRVLPMRKRWSWTREKLFPDPAYMRERYPVHGHVALLFAYARRLGDGLRMALRGRAP